MESGPKKRIVLNMKGKGKDFLGWGLLNGTGTSCGPKDRYSSISQVGEMEAGFGGGAAALLREGHCPEFMRDFREGWVRRRLPCGTGC